MFRYVAPRVFVVLFMNRNRIVNSYGFEAYGNA